MSGDNLSVLTIPGYSLTETVQENKDLILIKGLRETDLSRVLIVTAALQQARPESVERLENEYSLREELDPAWALQPIDRIRIRGQPTLIFPDSVGEPLARILEKPLTLPEALRIGIGAATALESLHKRNVVHKDIEPANLLVDKSTGAVQLMGFGIATRLAGRHAEPDAPEKFSGTLAYMSPEQTGRMSRAVDSRSDLYSLGITFYRMFTGALPFTAQNPMEWVHCHTARLPLPPAELVAGLPTTVSNVVMKLLAKIPEERYQTARGVKMDLRRCLDEWKSQGRMTAFPLGAHDNPGRLQIPDRLFGRDEALRTLLEAFFRVETTGLSEIAFVSGYSGVGKSSLVGRFHRMALHRNGLFASGKFEQYKRDIPYSPLANAFRSLIRKILAMDADAMVAWRDVIRKALDFNGQLMVDLIPELDLLLGRQPPVAELPYQEAQNRFHEVFRKFLGAFARQENPLVLFLDDLQWLDPASLKLFEYIATHPDVGNLLLIGAYRDNEVTPSHPLMLTIEAISENRTALHTLSLSPLSQADLLQLTSEALRSDPARIEPLARLVHEKTGGNHFFTIQFLDGLIKEGLLKFEERQETWVWDMERIRARAFTENVVDLMVGKLVRLSGPTLKALKGMACLGSAVGVSTLTRILGGSEQEIHADLREAVQAGLVLEVGDTYRFLHDRVREAAYSLIPEPELAGEHLQIGRLLLARLSPEEIEEQIFTLLNQFNRGIGLISDPAERARIRRMNAAASRKAKAGTAYAAASGYLAQAMALLPENPWIADYEETLSLTIDYSECEYLTGRFEQADDLFELILGKARADLDKFKVHRLRMKLYQSTGRFQEAVKIGLDGLESFGIRFPDSHEGIEAAFAGEMKGFKESLGSRRIADLADAPVVTDPDARTIIELFGELTAPVYITKPEIFPLLILKGLTVCLRHGNTDDACAIFAYGGILHADHLEDIPRAFEFSELALRLNDRFKDGKRRGKLLLLHGTLIHIWRRPFATAIPILEEAFDACLNFGDLVFAGYTSYLIVWQRFAAGRTFDEVLRHSEKSAAFTRQSRNEAMHQMIRLVQQHIACLKGLTLGPTSFDDGSFTEAESLTILAGSRIGTTMLSYSIMKQASAFIFGRYEEALEHSIRAEKELAANVPSPIWYAQCLFHALTLTALFPHAPTERRREFAETLDLKLRKLKLWADNCPENFLHCHALVSAEIARIEGRDLEAMRLYDQAIASAGSNGFLQNESLGCELAGRFYLDRGFGTIGFTYLRKARSGYRRWGAAGKVKQLNQFHPGLEEVRAGGAAMDASLEHLDMLAVVKASQAVSGEIVLESLVEKLLAIMIEHAGAGRGLLIHFHDGEPVLEAEAVTQRERIAIRFRHTPAGPEDLPVSLLNFTRRTQERIILDDASVPNPYSDDEYIRRGRTRSILCLPLVKQAKLVAVVYLENNLAPRAFTSDRIAVLEILASQAAISLENARLYDGLKKENAERKRAEERFSKAFNSSPTPMAIARAKDNAFVDANARFLEFFEYAREDFIGHSAQELGISDAHDVEKALQMVSESGAFHDVEFNVRTKSGNPRILLVSIETIELEGEKCLLITYLDLTERKKAEDQLRQSQKMEAIGRLAGGVAHDFNNLLTAINGYSSMALAELDPASHVHGYVRQTLNAGERAAVLTRQLLAHSRKQVLQPQVWDLGLIVREIVPMLRRLIGEDIILSTNRSPEPARVMVDRGQMEQVLLNLVVNSRDAMPHGGKLSITTGTAYLDPTYLETHPEASPGRHIVLSASDTGTGMTPEVKARLFEPFFTTKEEGKGTGLGLSVVYGIVKQSGGSIFVFSEMGKGTTFRIYLPAVSGSESVQEPSSPEIPESLRGGETLLLVEDSDSVRNFSRLALEAQGYRLIEARDGVEALELVGTSSSISLVLTDVVMPKMGGVALARQIRERFPSLPVVFMSGFMEHPGDDGGIPDGESSLLQKPFSPFELAKKVRETLDRSARGPEEESGG